MCDRALVMYEGRIIQELVGPAITETNLVTAALNLCERLDQDDTCVTDERETEVGSA